MRLEHHLVGGYVRYISPHIIIIITSSGYQILLLRVPSAPVHGTQCTCESEWCMHYYKSILLGPIKISVFRTQIMFTNCYTLCTYTTSAHDNQMKNLLKYILMLEFILPGVNFFFTFAVCLLYYSHYKDQTGSKFITMTIPLRCIPDKNKFNTIIVSLW